MQKRFGGGVTFVAQVIQKQASPGAVLHVVIELGVVSLMGLVQIRLVVEERPDGDENYGDGSAAECQAGPGRLSPHLPVLQFMLKVHGSPDHVPKMLRHTLPSA